MKEQIYLTENLKKKKASLEIMFGAVRRSIDFLEGENIDDFNREMDNCRACMKEIDGLNETIATMLIPETEKSSVIQQLEREIDQIINQLADANMECNSVAKEKLMYYGHQLRGLRQRRQGLMYDSRLSGKAAFVDLKL